MITTDQANYNGLVTYRDGPKGVWRQRTVPVDSFGPNPWGVYQVHGNVWEWTEDCYKETYAGAPTDGSAWTSGVCGERVVRGGSWYNYPSSVRAATRSGVSPDARNLDLSFRVARTLAP